jgi:t-SNARE complex subunit (syntaxin)
VSDLRTHLVTARTVAQRLRAAHRAGVRARLDALEAEVQENRRLNRRVAELTDLVTELMVPLARREDAAVEEILARYRSVI